VILAPCAAPKRSRPATRISRPQGTPTHDPRSNPGAASSDHERVGRFRRTPAAPNMLRCARIHALADGGYRQDPDVLGHGGLDLCRPMFAPCLLGRPGTSRYAPAAPGIRSPPRIRATAQNSRPRHESSSHDTRSERRIEQSSGLLICGFGVQVPGGAPILTWGFTVSGHLARRSDVGGPGVGPIGLDQLFEPLEPWLRSAIAAGRSRAGRLPPAGGVAVAIGLGCPAHSIRTAVVRHLP